MSNCFKLEFFRSMELGLLRTYLLLIKDQSLEWRALHMDNFLYFAQYCDIVPILDKFGEINSLETVIHTYEVFNTDKLLNITYLCLH